MRVYFEGFIEVEDEDQLDGAMGDVDNSVLSHSGNISWEKECSLDCTEIYDADEDELIYIQQTLE